MSDTDRPTLTKAPDLYVHYCEVEGCGKWGSLGNSPSKLVPVRWWCAEHFPEAFKINRPLKWP
ncbi:hypothetical protein ATY76_13615 [Rhizobium sp. R339]|uniref:hypothetical protein n=1 Tax=Rhizobium sp. R339 TaxID=1764273 RepID=UPI000B534381|nr:hypothetical protein [Rhizobium sp. R339]OWV67956.1 hypothetical protein ATY76_13615 [Rhizobium sp. R339]